jgi:hypothetical protein
MATERMYKMEWGDRYLNTTPEQQEKLNQWLYNKRLWHSIAWYNPSLTEQVKEEIEWITSPIVWKMTKQELFNTLVALQLLAEKTTEWMPRIHLPERVKNIRINKNTLKNLPESIRVSLYPQFPWALENAIKESWLAPMIRKILLDKWYTFTRKILPRKPRNSKKNNVA